MNMNLNMNIYDGFIVVDSEYRDARGRKLEVGKTYEIAPDSDLMSTGYLVTKNPLKVTENLSYYNRYLLVSVDGDVASYGSLMVVASKIHVEKELSMTEAMYQFLNFIDDGANEWEDDTQPVRLMTENNKMVSAPYCDTIALAGRRSSAAYSYAGGSGAITLGTESVAISESVAGLAAALNSWSVAMCEEDESLAVATGRSNTAIASGNLSVAVAVSDSTSAAIANTEGSISLIPSDGVAIANAPEAVAIGEYAKGVVGSLLVLLEIAIDYDSETTTIVNAKAIKVDGENFHEGTIYHLENGVIKVAM
jgi:hypothetical protein